ncbi:MAG: nuclear transport factor 2 family protein [Candidatus Binataceae bacterium]
MGVVSGEWQDREQIRELYARYSITLDSGDFAEWLDCFTDDAVLTSPRFGNFSGRANLRSFVARYKESLGGARVMHVNSNLSFALDGEHGRGGCYFTFFHCKDGRLTLAAIGHYRDRFHCGNSIWRFENREVFLDARPPTASV